MTTCEQYKALLAGLLDNELTPDEGADLNTHLIRCASCRADYEELRKTENMLAALSFVEITDEAATAFWRLPYSRLLRNAALLMIIGGYLTLVVIGFVAFLVAGTEGLLNKLPVAAIFIGTALLLGLVLVERIKTYKVDPYREVER
jgi:predicted anti-sigma-YlaC factor YlaD